MVYYTNYDIVVTVSKYDCLFLLLLILPPNHRPDEFYDADGGPVRSHPKSLWSLLFENILRVKNTIRRTYTHDACREKHTDNTRRVSTYTPRKY